ALIPRPGFPPTPAPLLPRAIPGAVPLAVIAVAANAHPYAAAPALVCPERPLSHRNAIPMKDWTMPGDACIKEPWSCLSHAPHRRPGVDRQIPPGPSLIRRRLKNNQDFGARRRQTINRSLSAAALLMGRTISGEQGRTDFGKRLSRERICTCRDGTERCFHAETPPRIDVIAPVSLPKHELSRREQFGLENRPARVPSGARSS